MKLKYRKKFTKKSIKKSQSAIDTMINWDYHPTKIEAEVDKKPLSEADQKLLEQLKVWEDIEFHGGVVSYEKIYQNKRWYL